MASSPSPMKTTLTSHWPILCIVFTFLSFCCGFFFGCLLINLTHDSAEEVTANSVTVIGAMVLLERLLRKLPPRQKMTVQSQTVMFMCCLAVYHKQTVDIHYNSKSFAIFAGQPPSRFYKQELLALSILDFDTAVSDSELSAMFSEIIASS